MAGSQREYPKESHHGHHHAASEEERRVLRMAALEMSLKAPGRTVVDPVELIARADIFFHYLLTGEMADAVPASQP